MSVELSEEQAKQVFESGGVLEMYTGLGWVEAVGFVPGAVYREGRKKKYRPYNDEEMVGLLGKSIRTIDSRILDRDFDYAVVTMIGWVDDERRIFWNPEGSRWTSPEQLFIHWQFMDGSPCGVEVTE